MSGERTRAALISAAEKLFAADGVSATSISSITRLAGQRNHNAVGFHFGTKAELLTAVLDKHRSQVNEDRSRIIAELPDDEPDARAVARVLVEPLTNRLVDPDGGHEYICIQAELMSKRADTIPADPHESLLWVMDKAFKMFEIVSVGQAAQAGLVVAVVFHGLADFGRRFPEATTDERRAFGLLVESNVTAMLMQPQMMIGRPEAASQLR